MKLFLYLSIILMISTVTLAKKEKTTTDKAKSADSKDLTSKPSINKKKAKKATTTLKKKKHRKKKRKLIVKAVKPETKDEILAKFNITPDSIYNYFSKNRSKSNSTTFI